MAVVDLIKGKKLADARTLNDGDVFRALQEIPVQKLDESGNRSQAFFRNAQAKEGRKSWRGGLRSAS
jgi:hypothetical protein